MTRMPTYFINHGGGPWPWVPARRSRHAVLERALAAMPGDRPEPPKAVLMVSGHWEAEGFHVMHADRPGMLYDYYNFPPHTYEVR